MDMVFHCCVVFIMDRINKFLLSYGKQRKEIVLQKYVDLFFLAEMEGFVSTDDTTRAHLFREVFLCVCVGISSCHKDVGIL